MRRSLIALTLLGLAWPTAADLIGSVDTRFKWTGPDDKIVVEAFQDEDLPGIACYLSRAKTGGLSGAIGVAEDTSDADIECIQTGVVTLPEDIKSGKRNGQQVFKKRTSLFFKTLQVVRFYDAPRNALIYLTYSDRVIEGSPKNSLSAVSIQPWQVRIEGTPASAPTGGTAK
jgi:CreA protein